MRQGRKQRGGAYQGVVTPIGTVVKASYDRGQNVVNGSRTIFVT